MALAWPKVDIETGQLEPTEFKSLGLELIRNALKDDRKYQILDLGSAQGPNIDFFSQVSCRIHVEDLYDSWSRLPPRAEDQEPFSAAELDTLLSHDRSARFDVILGWDLYDYFDPRFICLLTSHLKRYCRRRALLFMLTSTRQQIPATPARLVITGEDSLHYAPRTTEPMNNPNYTPRAFERMMKGFRLLHSFMLKNGMQEYVFTSS